MFSFQADWIPSIYWYLEVSNNKFIDISLVHLCSSNLVRPRTLYSTSRSLPFIKHVRAQLISKESRKKRAVILRGFKYQIPYANVRTHMQVKASRTREDDTLRAATGTELVTLISPWRLDKHRRYMYVPLYEATRWDVVTQRVYTYMDAYVFASTWVGLQHFGEASTGKKFRWV